MASKELSIIIKARDLASRAIKGVRSQVKGLGSDAKKAVSNASKNIARIGAVVAGGLALAIGQGIKSIADIQKAQSETTAVIKSTAGAAGQTMDMVIARSKKWSAAIGRNEEDVQHLQNVLLTFTNIGPTVFDEATTAALNMSQVLGQDLQQSAVQLGKALNDPVKGMTALRRVGVSFTEDQVKTVKKLVAEGKDVAAQQLILTELNKEFGGQATAYGKTLAGQWDIFKQNVQAAERALATAFLPILTKVGGKINDLLQRPEVMAGITSFGEGLAGTLQQVLDAAVKLPWGSISNAFQLMGSGAKAALDLFLGMPPWVQTAVLTGWGLNKLTGGALGSIVAKLGTGLIKGVLGMNAGVVNAKAAVVNVAGGLPSAGGGPVSTAEKAAGATGLLGFLQKRLPLIGGLAGPLSKVPGIGGILSGIPTLGGLAAIGGGAFIGANVGGFINENFQGVKAARTGEQSKFDSLVQQLERSGSREQITSAIGKITQALNPKDFASQMAIALDVGKVKTTLNDQLDVLNNVLNTYDEQHSEYTANEQKANSERAKAAAAMAKLGVTSLAGSTNIKDAITRQNPELAAITANTAKRTSVNVTTNASVSVRTYISIKDWQRQVVSDLRASAGSGGFI